MLRDFLGRRTHVHLTRQRLIPYDRKKSRKKTAQRAPWNTQRQRVSLGADRGAEGVSEGLAEALDVGFLFSFYHDAG